MNKTLQYYSDHAKEYIEATMNFDMRGAMSYFLSLLGRRGVSILDIGFGSGRDSLSLQQNKYRVTSLDPVEVFCEHGKEIGLKDVVCDSILSYKTKKRFKGIWACASLHHLNMRDFKKAIEKCYLLLQKGGIFYLSLKITDKEDPKGRYFLKISMRQFKSILKKAGFSLYEVWQSKDAQGREEEWLNAFAYKNSDIRNL